MTENTVIELEKGQWIFPRPADILEPVSPEMASLVHGALNFSSDAKHTSDYVMAWWICWLQMAKDEGVHRGEDTAKARALAERLTMAPDHSEPPGWPLSGLARVETSLPAREA